MVQKFFLIAGVCQTVDHFLVQAEVGNAEVFEFWCWVALGCRMPHVVQLCLSPVETGPCVEHLILVSAEVGHEVVHGVIFCWALF